MSARWFDMDLKARVTLCNAVKMNIRRATVGELGYLMEQLTLLSFDDRHLVMAGDHRTHKDWRMHGEVSGLILC